MSFNWEIFQMSRIAADELSARTTGSKITVESDVEINHSLIIDNNGNVAGILTANNLVVNGTVSSTAIDTLAIAYSIALGG